MKKTLLPFLLLLAFLMLSPLHALASPDIPDPASDAAAWLRALYTAMTTKEWSVAFGLALVGVVYVMRRWVVGRVSWFRKPLGGLVLGFVTALAATIGVALAAGAHISISLALTSLSSAATAAGVWEWLKAHIPGVDAAAVAAGSPMRVQVSPETVVFEGRSQR